MMDRLIHIGDVLVHVGEPEGGNPYHGFSLLGDERVAALRQFANGHPDSKYTFWYAPVHGGARRLTDPAEVDWRGLHTWTRPR